MKNQTCLCNKALKQSFLILFCIIPFFQNCFSQSCSDTAKKIDYSAAGYTFGLNQHIISQNDIAFLAGRFQNYSQKDSGIFVFKISADGNPFFSKKINSDFQPNQRNCNDFLNLKNGNSLIAIGQIVIPGSADPTFRLIMLDKNGNLIWAKKYFDSYSSPMALNKIAETENGDIILMLNFYDADPLVNGLYDVKTALIKIDNNGNVIWSNYYSLLKDKILDGEAIAVFKNNIYVVGYTIDHDDFYLGYPDYEHNTWALKLNETTGSLIDSKSFLNLRIQNLFYGFSSYPTIYANLVNTDANNFTFTNKFGNFLHNLYGLEKIKMDTNLNFSGALFYNYNAIKSSIERIIANAKGETFTYATDAEGSYISKFNSSDQPIREIKIKFPTGSNFQGNSWKPIGLKDKYINIINTYSLNSDTHFQLNQIPDDAPLSDCYGTDSSFVKQESYPITEVSHPFISGVHHIPIQSTDFTATVSDLPLTTAFDCVIKSNCDNLSVSGNDSICQLNKPYTFVAHKNANCNKHVLWQIDSTAIQLKEQVNDTTINIQFKENWSGYLYASINSCTLLKDSIKINVPSSPASINLGNDTSLCTGEQLILNAKAGFISYLWQNGTADSIFSVAQAGTYFVVAKDYCNNIYSDTINITYNQPSPIHLGNDTSICNNLPLELNAGNSFMKYKWNTGEATQSIRVNSIGDYSVSATNSYGCVSADTIKIVNAYSSPIINLSKQNVLCLHQNDTLDAGSGYASYLWQNGEMQRKIDVTSPGFYKVTVGNNYNCYASDSVNILQVAIPPADFLPPGVEICSDDSINIAPLPQFNEYLWSTGSTDNAIKINKPGTYWLNVKDENSCTGSDTINIVLKDCEVRFFVPNAFSPNNDGLNDIFHPIINGKISEYYFAVYNRYGQMVFNTDNINIGWNGTVKGQPQNSGIFVWHARYKIKNEEIKIVKGSVLLVR